MLKAEDIWFAYVPGADAYAVRGVSLDVSPGEVVALVGPNGCGKSTLVRVLAGSLPLQRGRIEADGALGEGEPGCCAVGYVRQDPKSQLVAPVVFDEVAFGPCNLGLPVAEVERRVHEALKLVGLVGYEDRLADTLSGGEQQRLALAGVLANRPSYLVLDEVTSFLDEGARCDIRSLIRRLSDAGTGILLVTHNADDVLCCDRVVAMNRGLVVWNGGPRDAVARKGPSPSDARHLAKESIEPEAAGCVEGPNEPTGAAPTLNARGAKPVLVARDLTVLFNERELLSRVSLDVRPGELLLVTGPSGSGKTTLARVLAGVLAPDGGEARITCAGREPEPVRPGMVGLCLQRPEEQFVRATVIDDVALAPENMGASHEEVRERAEETLRWLGVPKDLWEASLWGLSGGEARLVAIAGVVAQGSEVVILDEPTAGLDGEASGRVCEVARALADAGRAVVVVSHDLGEWLPVADRVALLREGSLVWSGPVGALEREVADGLASDAGKDLASDADKALVSPSPWRIRSAIWRGEGQ